MRRTDLMDTSDWAYREMVRRLRAMTPEERFRLAVELTDLGGEIHKAALRLREQRLQEKGSSGSE